MRVSAAALALFCAAAASAQDAADEEEARAEIVVVGTRGSLAGEMLPVAEFDAGAIAATGATTIPELLQAIRGATQSADGGEPIFLLNAQRVSGYPEIGSLPPEAIEKVEVLPEQMALKFGFPPTRRVVNFITKRVFQQLEVRGSAGTSTRGGTTTQKANLGMTRLQEGRRLTLGLEYRHTDPLFLTDRNILPDAEVPFDAIGNVTGLSGGEVDPALSAAAGSVVTIAPVPGAPGNRGTLGAYAAGANRPRLFEDPVRTLVPANNAIKGELVLADKIGKTLSGSISLSAEHSRDRSITGPANARLLVPDGNAWSPFSVPVILNRYLFETDPLRQREEVTTLQGGVTLRGAIAGWRWDFTGSFNERSSNGLAERGIDPAAANAAIAAGTNPFAALDEALLRDRLTDRTTMRSRTTGGKTVVTNNPVQLPAGRVTVTATVEAERMDVATSLRGRASSDLALGRTRLEGGLAVDVPIASRREDVLPFLGELSANVSVNARDVSGFGGLRDSTFGLAWSPIRGVQFLATLRSSAVAPNMNQQLTPTVRTENVPVFDFARGRTDLVTLLTGGNPDLAATRRNSRSLGVNIRPFEKKEIRFSATWESAEIRDQTGTVYAITAQTEAMLPGLLTRDAGGRLTSVAYRPVNFALERTETLNITVNASGRIGAAPPPRPPGPPAPGTRQPPQPPGYYAGIGPSIRFRDRLQLAPGGPELDLLAGDTIWGSGMSRVSGYAYGGFYYRGHGASFNAWYSAPNRVRGTTPASNLRFGSVFRLSFTGYLGLGSLMPKEQWARRLRLGLEVQNATDFRQTVRDGNGNTPFRHQRDLLEPTGRTVTLSLRKLF